MLRRTLLVLGLVLATTSCASAKKAYHRASEELSDAAKAYNESVRAGDAERAMEFIPAADRPAFVTAITKQSKEVRFTEMKVGPLDFPKGSNEATVTVTRSFHRLDAMVEQTETINQTWFRKELRWYLRFNGTP